MTISFRQSFGSFSNREVSLDQSHTGTLTGHAYALKVELAHSNTPSSRRTDVASPRNRNEAFDQSATMTYSFCEDDTPVVLHAIHRHREILIEVEVATGSHFESECPPLSATKTNFANQLMSAIRNEFEGMRATICRFIRRQQKGFIVEGPFTPFSPQRAIVCLRITVSRDANYDDAYRIVQRFIEHHPKNDDQPDLAYELSPDQYEWSIEELDAVERMARLESKSRVEDSKFTERERAEYNERLLAEIHDEEQLDCNAATSATAALRVLFNS